MWRTLNGTSTILRRRVLSGGSGLRRPFTPFAGGSGLRRPLTGMCLRRPSLTATGDVGLGRAASPLSLCRGIYSKGPFEKKNEELTWFKTFKLVVNRVFYIRLMKMCKRNTTCRRKMIEFMVSSQNLKNYWISVGKGERFDQLSTYTLSEACLAFVETYTPTFIYFVLLSAGGLSTLVITIYNDVKVQKKINMVENSFYKTNVKYNSLVKEIKEISGQQKELSKQHDDISKKQDDMTNKQVEMTKKQDEMTKKQDEMTKEQVEMTKKQDEMKKEQVEMTKKQEQQSSWWWWW